MVLVFVEGNFQFKMVMMNTMTMIAFTSQSERAINHSEAESTVLISCDIKSLT